MYFSYESSTDSEYRQRLLSIYTDRTLPTIPSLTNTHYTSSITNNSVFKSDLSTTSTLRTDHHDRKSVSMMNSRLRLKMTITPRGSNMSTITERAGGLTLNVPQQKSFMFGPSDGQTALISESKVTELLLTGSHCCSNVTIHHVFTVSTI